MESLALKYRPRTFDDLVGQRAVQVVLRQMVDKGRVPRAMTFSGGRGTGKTTTLRILAAALNCDTPPGPCGHCVPCKSTFDGTNLNLVEIDAASNGLVDDIRQLRQHALYAVGGGWRVIGLDEAQSISTAGFNALLKMIEEPPPDTVFVLLTTEPGRIPDTVASRCTRFTFRRIAPADITERLTQICTAEGITVEPGLLSLVAERADGALRDAVMLLDQITQVGVNTVEQFVDVMGETDPGPALLGAIRTGNHATAFGALADTLTRTADPATIATALAATLRDVCILHAAGTVNAQGEALSAREQLAAALDTPTAVAGLKLLWDHKTKIRSGDDPRTGLDLLVAMLVDALAPARPTAPAASPERRLTLAEMAARR